MESVLTRLLGGATDGFDIDVSALLTSAPYGFFLTVDGPADLPASADWPAAVTCIAVPTPVMVKSGASVCITGTR